MIKFEFVADIFTKCFQWSEWKRLTSEEPKKCKECGGNYFTEEEKQLCWDPETDIPAKIDDMNELLSDLLVKNGKLYFVVE